MRRARARRSYLSVVYTQSLPRRNGSAAVQRADRSGCIGALGALSLKTCLDIIPSRNISIRPGGSAGKKGEIRRTGTWRDREREWEESRPVNERKTRWVRREERRGDEGARAVMGPKQQCGPEWMADT